MATVWSRSSIPLRCAALVLVLNAAWAGRTFDQPLLLETKGETSAGVSLGDLDGDGDLDIVLAKGRHWPLHNLILRNDGKGAFTTETFGSAADRTYSAALADLDGDGDLDIAVSNDNPDKKLIYRNVDEKGRMQLAGAFGEPGWNTRYITLADLNGDGRPDILAANRGSLPARPSASYFCLNDGNAAFPHCQPLATQSATIIVAADLDGDGSIDVAVPHRDGGQGAIFWNDGKANFSKPTIFGPSQSFMRAAAAGDLNGDGRPDLVAGDERTGLYWFANLGRREFGPAIRLGGPSRSPYAIVLADMDRDGRTDIVVGNMESPGSIFFARAAGKFEEIQWGDGKGAVYGLALGDLNGDGWLDIAAARSGAPNAVWFSRPRP